MSWLSSLWLFAQWVITVFRGNKCCTSKNTLIPIIVKVCNLDENIKPPSWIATMIILFSTCGRRYRFWTIFSKLSGLQTSWPDTWKVSGDLCKWKWYIQRVGSGYPISRPEARDQYARREQNPGRSGGKPEPDSPFQGITFPARPGIKTVQDLAINLNPSVAKAD